MRSSALAFSLILLGCSQTKIESGSPDASAPAATAPRAIAVLRAHTGLTARAGIGGSLSLDAQGHRLQTQTTGGFRSGAIDAVLPRRADGPLRVSIPGRAGAYLDIVAEGARAVESRVADRAVVHEDAFPATDVVHVADASRIEELRVLRGPAAPKNAIWTITRGPEVAALRIHGDRIEAIDASGGVLLSTEPIVAIDADDVTRTPTIALAGDRLTVTLDTEGLAYPIVLDPSWIPNGTDMVTTGRLSPWMYKLADGRILVLGGTASSTVAELYDPATDTWAADVVGRHLLTARERNAMYTPLPSGKILISGGTSGTSAEIYDPATLTSVATGNMKIAARYGAAAIVVPGNRVAVLGGAPQLGSGAPVLSTNETYDISSGSWTLQPTSLPGTRGYAVSALLATGPNAGKILLAGGRGGGTGWLSSAEIVDPTTFASTPIASMSTPRSLASSTLLTKGPNAGKILIAGGDSGPYNGLSTVEIFDPATSTFSPAAPMTAPHYDAASLTLSDGRFVVIAGNSPAGQNVADVYDPVSGVWSALKPLLTGPYDPSAIEISGARILVVGDAKGEVYWPDPVSCTSGSMCPTGLCVDGYCCESACTAQCMACDVPGRGGICTPVDSAAPHGARAACGAYVQCAAGACATSCGADGACSSGYFCDGPSSKCLVKKPSGSGCTGNSQCSTGYCVDGYCCSSSCAGTCSACDVAGSEGVCKGVLGTPHGSRSCPSPFACNAGGSCATSCAVDTDCATTHYCVVASGTCALRLPNGVACTGGGQCQSSNCVDGYCCDKACNGQCQACDVGGKLGICSSVDSGAPHAARTCAPYASCKLGACAGGCATATDCTAGGYCSATKCVGGKIKGAPCGTGAECTSGFCADGVCCNSACTEDCGACAAPGLEGTCSPRSASASCGTSGCSGAKIVTLGHCSGTTLGCVPGTATPCAGSLVCADAAVCKTMCVVASDCTTGACDTATGTCTTPDGGAPDSGADAVADTSVADSTPDASVTETASGSDAIAMEPAPKVADHPSVDGFTRCTKGSECGSGFCVEGVCCDSACTDACHSCALLTNPGKCTVEPIGVDLRSNCGPANSCLGTCDGRGQCIGAGTGTMCARNRCTTASSGVGPAYCPAPGAACPTDNAVTFDCAPYVCEPAFGACRTQCSATSDCANGNICDVASHTCAPPPPAAPSGGCVLGTTGPSGASVVVAAFGLLLAAARRRRKSVA